jgi:hypothetical protein
VDGSDALSREYNLFADLANHNYVRIQNAEFAYNKLRSMQDLIVANLIEVMLSGSSTSFSATGIDLELNRVTVYLYPFNDDEITSFKNTVANSPMIVFREHLPSSIRSRYERYFGGQYTPCVISSGEYSNQIYVGVDFCLATGISLYNLASMGLYCMCSQYTLDGIQEIRSMQQITLRPGQRIWFRNPSVGYLREGFGSIGYRVADSTGSMGFTTSTHGLLRNHFVLVQDSYINPWYPHKVHVGVVHDVAHFATGRRCPINPQTSDYDSSFVRFLDGVNVVISHVPITQSTPHTTVTRQVLQGDPIAKVGGRSLITTGTVTDLYALTFIFTSPWDGFFQRTVQTNASGGPGDSGGIVFHGLTRDIMGIVQGGDHAYPPWHILFPNVRFTRASNAHSAHQVTPI